MGYWERHNERVRHTHRITLFRFGSHRLVLTYVPRRYRKTAADLAYEQWLARMAEKISAAQAERGAR